ncbi:MAG: M15 family metallopeptidase [Treponema sp.]|nr:M15 family metallopeptidase [Treponema sp.]
MIKPIRRIAFLCAVFVILVCTACSKQAVAQTPSSVIDVRHNPEIMKLQTVLSQLSERAQNAIPNGDPQEFISDLYRVLEADADDLLILCDKKHSIGKDYVPSDIVHLDPNPLYRLSRNNLSLRKPAFDALTEMAQAANKAGINLLVSSTYRSYDYQVIVYNRLVKLEGQEVADRESARPGTSQHQLGTVIDFGSIDDDYAETRDCKWLTANAEKYGWSLSFPDGYEQDTGYRWECWHFRYIGKEACQFQKKWFSDIQQYMLEFIYAWKNAQ